MPKPVRSDAQSDALAQFDYHRDQMRIEQQRASEARKKASAHFQILRGLSQLHPEVAERFKEMLSDVTEPDRGFDPNQRFATARAVVTSPSEDHSKTLSEALPVDRRPLGMEAITQVLADHPGEYFSVAAIHQMLCERGWAEGGDMALRVTRNTLNRAVGSNKVMRRDIDGYHVQYALIPAEWHLDPGMAEVVNNDNIPRSITQNAHVQEVAPAQ